VTTTSQVFTHDNSYDGTTLLVKFKSNIVAADISNIANRVGATSRAFRGINRVRATAIKNWRVFSLPANSNLSQMRIALQNTAGVERVEYNYRVSVLQIPNDAFFSQLWGFDNFGQTGGIFNADINAPEAWDITTGSPNTLVAVIDTGVDYTHPDLADNIWTNPGEIPGNGIDDDLNGYVDDIHGYDFAYNDGDPFDDFGHGTHVAGTIAAVGNNGIGVTGVNWQAKIMAVKMLDATGGGTTAAAVESVLYATNMGAKISNNSWGGGGFSQALLDAILAANDSGALFVAAAGNASSNNDLFPEFPASYDAPNIISVAATDHNDFMAYFSNYGATTVDLGAPGVSIYSTVPAIGNPCCSNSIGYMYLDGTSMASPHVAGAATLLMSYFSTETHLQIKQRLLGSAQPIASLSGITVTGGRLDIVSSLENDTTPPAAVTDLTAPTAGAFSVELTFTATGDDNNVGTASSYDIRYSTSPIDDINFTSAIAVAGPQPSPAGTLMNAVVSGLNPSTNYYFAVKASDNVGNISAISNIATTTTLAVQTIYSEDFENGLTNWTIAGTDGLGGPSLWHLSSHRFNSPNNSLYYGNSTSFTYDTGAANSGSATSAPIDLTQSPSDVTLQFYYYLRSENLSPFDTAQVSISNDGGFSWVQLWTSAYDSVGTDLVPVTVSLAGYAGSVIQLQFSFDTLDLVLNNFEGWVVDDINIVSSITTPTNNPPVAIVGGPYSGTHNIAVLFDGSGSSDPDGDALVYSWDFGDGSTDMGVSPAHVYSADGSYVVTLTVSDGTLTATATTTVNVTNIIPIANAGGPYSSNPGLAIQFDASGSSDGNNDPLSYVWDFGDGTIGSGVNPSHAYNVAGAYNVTLVVNDGFSDSNPVTASVTIAANREPIANAGADQTVIRQSLVTLDSSNSYDPDGSIISFAWKQISGKPLVTLVNANEPIATFTAPNAGANPKEFKFLVTVTDNNGLSSSDEIIIRVTK